MFRAAAKMKSFGLFGGSAAPAMARAEPDYYSEPQMAALESVQSIAVVHTEVFD